MKTQGIVPKHPVCGTAANEGNAACVRPLDESTSMGCAAQRNEPTMTPWINNWPTAALFAGRNWLKAALFAGFWTTNRVRECQVRCSREFTTKSTVLGNGWISPRRTWSSRAATKTESLSNRRDAINAEREDTYSSRNLAQIARFCPFALRRKREKSKSKIKASSSEFLLGELRLSTQDACRHRGLWI